MRQRVKELEEPTEGVAVEYPAPDWPPKWGQGFDLEAEDVGFVEELTFDTSGNIPLPGQIIYRVPAGAWAVLQRLIITHPAFTPAAPFSSGTAWLGIYDGDDGSSLMDFAPATPGGPLLPALFESASDRSGALFYGPKNIMVAVPVGGASLASTATVPSVAVARGKVTLYRRAV